MTGYTKKIAVIKQIQHGFSSDGGSLSGVVKAETYAGFLKVEASLINFAPLSEGRYVSGISDGLKTVIFEGGVYEGESDLNLTYGFAFLVCFCNGGCRPIATAACGQMACALPDLKEEMTRREGPDNDKINSSGSKRAGAQIKEAGGKDEGAAYDDEAIAQVNYYELSDENGDALRADKTQEKGGLAGGENEEDFGPFKEQESGLNGTYIGVNGKKEQKTPPRKARRNAPPSSEKESAKDKFTGGEKGKEAKENERQNGGTKDGAAQNIGPLSGGDFYGRMRPDIEKIFSSYPKEEGLERAMEGSRWARIGYGKNRYYVFGVLSVEGSPRYICYGVPSADGKNPPSGLGGYATYFPVAGGGYWIMYQDANTGVSVKISLN